MANSYQYYLDKCAPNTNLKLDWSSYSLRDFTSAFLPNIAERKYNNYSFFDGLELFQNMDEQRFKSDLSISTLSFPSDAEANSKKSKIEDTVTDILVFANHGENENIVELEISRGRDLLKKLGTKSTSSINKATITVSKDMISKLNSDEYLTLLLENLNIDANEYLIQESEKMMQKNIDEYFENMNLLSPEFDAGFIRNKHPDAWAHGDIEKAGLKKFFKPKEILQTYYGNWLRDYSSCLAGSSIGFDFKDRETLAKDPYNTFPTVKANKKYYAGNFSHATWIRVIYIMAVKEFVYKPLNNSNLTEDFSTYEDSFLGTYGKLTKDILGLYRPEEHIDNPKGLLNETTLSNPSWVSKKLNDPIFFKYEYQKGHTKKLPLYPKESPESLEFAYHGKYKLKKYIIENVDNERPSSLNFVNEQLTLAAKYGKTKEGLRHLGAALHVVEDYFAHSNFVEISLIKHGHINVHPWVVLDKETKKIKDGRKKASKIPVVTGNFGFLDMIASVAPKISKEYFPKEIQQYKHLNPGDRTFGDELILAILKDWVQKDHGNPKPDTVQGYTYLEILSIYHNFLWIRDKYLELLATVPNGELIKIAIHYLGQYLMFIPNLIIGNLIDRTSLYIKHKQHQIKNYGTDPSHTQLAKDGENHVLNPIAGQLARIMVESIGDKMNAIWNKQFTLQLLLEYVKKRVFIHPMELDWMDETVKKWAKSHPRALVASQGKSPIQTHKDLYEYDKKVAEKRINKFYKDTRKALDDLGYAHF